MPCTLGARTLEHHAVQIADCQLDRPALLVAHWDSVSADVKCSQFSRLGTEPEEIEGLLRRAAGVLNPAQIWVNPDCGLKTRGWKEVLPSLTAMVLAASLMRRDLQASP